MPRLEGRGIGRSGPTPRPLRNTRLPAIIARSRNGAGDGKSEQAQAAHDLALERIAEAEADREQALCLSTREFNFGGKPYPGDERLKHLTALPPEIAGLTALQSLDLRRTQVADIAPLTWLEKLGDLSFNNTPVCATDPKLAELSEIEDDDKRTRLTLAYLREKVLATERSGNETVIKPAVGKASVTGHDATIITPEQACMIQRQLAEAGFDPGPVDGIIGAKTRQAMQAALDQGNREGSGDLWRNFNELKDFLDGLKKPEPEPPPRPDETAPFYSDQPATQDLLNRRAVAETLGTIDTEVTERLEKATTEQAVVRIVDEEAKRSPMRGAIAGARAFQHMQSRELVSEREHFLAQYADLLEANPRAMKRLLNAYGFRRGFDIQSPHRSDPDALVRWTILENRWPNLADHLAGRSAGRGDGALIDALKKDPDVLDVAKGLTWDKLRTIAGAPAQPRD